MNTTKKCNNCGADNDILFSKCLYCKTSLPMDLNSISNEELILNAGEWVGKVGEPISEIKENFNAWTGKGHTFISANQVEGMALKYLSLLQIRASNDLNLKLSYDSLKVEFDNKRKLSILRNPQTLGLLVIALMFVVGAIVIIVGIKH